VNYLIKQTSQELGRNPSCLPDGRKMKLYQMWFSKQVKSKKNIPMTCNYKNSDPTQGNFRVNIVIRNLELVCSQSFLEAQFYPSTIKATVPILKLSFGLTFVPFPMWHATL